MENFVSSFDAEKRCEVWLSDWSVVGSWSGCTEADLTWDAQSDKAEAQNDTRLVPQRRVSSNKRENVAEFSSFYFF